MKKAGTKANSRATRNAIILLREAARQRMSSSTPIRFYCLSLENQAAPLNPCIPRCDAQLCQHLFGPTRCPFPRGQTHGYLYFPVFTLAMDAQCLDQRPQIVGL